MKIICVLGGSYKSFYLNHLKSINRCDLLVFNFGLIYNYNVKDELLGQAIVTKELMSLARRLHCVVVAGVLVEAENLTKAIILCDGEKVDITPAKAGLKLFTNKKEFVVGDENLKAKGCDKIVLSNKRIYPSGHNISCSRTYIFCDKFGVTIVKNKKIIRKFNKYSKIILK